MELIRRCFDEHNKALMIRLLGAGFSTDLARLFLPEAALAMCLSCRKSSEFQTIACLFSKSRYPMLRTIDIDEIAKNTGVEKDQVIIGLQAIAPVLLQAYARKGNCLEQVSATGATEELA